VPSRVSAGPAETGRQAPAQAGKLAPAQAGKLAPAQAGKLALSPDSVVAGEIKALVLGGQRDAARDLFADLVAGQQRRAIRLAYQYLRDAHDADEAVQDAFVKVFTHITTYREDMSFEVWFTRILVNGCLDLRKARARRLRWVLPIEASDDTRAAEGGTGRSVEDTLVTQARVREIAAAVDQLPERQRSVFMLCHFGDQTTSQVSQVLGLSEATVRVHLFRAVHKLRRLLER
jgi:RNA polymerase sigma-70 factor (ECF subfamily)